MNVHATLMTSNNGEDLRRWLNAIVAASRMNPTALAKAAGLSHTTLSRALDPAQRPPNFRASTIAKLTRIGGIQAPESVSAGYPGGFSESDAVQSLDAAPGERRLNSHQSVWIVQTAVLAAVGMLPGDRFVLDDSIKARDFDVVIAQSYNLDLGTAETLLRVYHDGFLVTPNYLTDRTPRLYVDNNSVKIAGVIIESWRTRN